MPLLTERELRKMSVRPIYALCGGGLGSALLYLPIMLSFGAAPWWMFAWMLVCLIGLVAALVYVHRAP